MKVCHRVVADFFCIINVKYQILMVKIRRCYLSPSSHGCGNGLLSRSPGAPVPPLYIMNIALNLSLDLAT